MMASLDNDFLPLLKISETQHFKQFLYECADELAEKVESDFNNYNSSDIEWTIEEYEKAKKCIKFFFRQCVIQGKFEIHSETLTESLKETISDCYEIKKDAIFQALAKENMLNKGCNLVENFDWKLKWILGSSELASLREPLLQVDFLCSKNSAEKTEKNMVSFEAKLEQIEDLIKELTRVHQDLN